MFCLPDPDCTLYLECPSPFSSQGQLQIIQIIQGLTLNVLSHRSPSWVSLSKQGLPASLSPSTVLIPFLVLSTVCSHFTLLFTCLLCREGCSLHLPGQPTLFPTGLAADAGFLRGLAFCC